MPTSLQDIFPVACARLPGGFWEYLAQTGKINPDPEEFPVLVQGFLEEQSGPGYLGELARVELAAKQLRRRKLPALGELQDFLINPTLQVIEVAWHSLLPLLEGTTCEPSPGQQILLFWRQPRDDQPRWAAASPTDLLALKVVAEGLDPEGIAAANDQPVGVIDGAMEQAVAKGLLLAPESALVRKFSTPSASRDQAAARQQTEMFTLQWHITHRCDLHCRHCYDRSRKEDVSLAQGLKILDQMRDFCRRRHVTGQVSFSGGNPFLHPQFPALYRATCDRGLTPAILGNPVPEERLVEILRIRRPAFFQVSLEGLRDHNDAIRGRGNFDAVLAFLDLLRGKNVYSMVMLTLTRANLDQVLPLADLLKERVDLFTYNRLAMVGEGAKLVSPGPEEYHSFCRDYLEARKSNPVMALKDSLLNIELEAQGEAMFGGCTGFGCGAAFNFVSVLPDGEVHACRKFPSPIGNLQEQTLAEIYDAEAAAAYRQGCQACDGCRLRTICGGCLAVAHGFGLDPLADKDPACFIR